MKNQCTTGQRLRRVPNNFLIETLMNKQDRPHYICLTKFLRYKEETLQPEKVEEEFRPKIDIYKEFQG